MPEPGFGRRWDRWLRALGAAAVAMLLTGCSSYPLSPIKPQGLVARQDDNLYEIVSIISYVVFVIVGGLIVYSAIRFRRPRNVTNEEPRQVFGNTPLEVTWTFIPVLIVALLFALAVQTLQATAVPSTPPKGALTIDVIGHQWYWEYKYTQYGIDYMQTAGASNSQLTDGLHVPIHRTVILRILAADVQHGYWVPALSGKTEAIPGHVNMQQFVVDTPGTYYAVCHYYCGTYHYHMWGNVVAQSEADFSKWLSAKRAAVTPTPAPRPTIPNAPIKPAAPVSFSKDIQPIFQAHCAACHIDQQLGGLSLSSYQGLIKGGNVVPGSIVTAGNFQASALWHIVQPSGPWPGGNRMPLGGPYLSTAQIQTIATWINQGAKNN